MPTPTVCRAASLALAICVVGCVDPSAVSVFDCDSGDCHASSRGGGAAQAGGGQGGGAEACGPDTCNGCCDGATCVADTTPQRCGVKGAQCASCGPDEGCVRGACAPVLGDGARCTEDAMCASGFCAGGACCGTRCDGPCEACGEAGVCRISAAGTTTAACGAFACDGLGAACPTTCTGQQQCGQGHFCDEAGACVPRLGLGATCRANLQCASGFCADGVCCDGACTGSCDRCNLVGQEGLCRPAPAGDRGSPACGGNIACNGALPDCPIACGNGCPSGTWCSGEYCAARKPVGAACGVANECASDYCVDGVCCDGACGGVCQACVAARGATADGVCTLLGANTVCRPAAGACDVEERCTGTQATCPANAYAAANAVCGQTTYTAWGACEAGTTCATSGTQSRTRAERRCTANGACQATNTPESQACTRDTDDVVCGDVTTGPWSTCTYSNSICTTTGTRSRSVVGLLCSGGTCGQRTSTEVDTQGCVRNTEGASCGSSTPGAWGECDYGGSACATTGTRTRPVSSPECSGGVCTPHPTMESTTQGCARQTSGNTCGTTTYGDWSACDYGNSPCATSGTRTRSMTTYTCGNNGGCSPHTTTQSDTQGCTRQTAGVACGTTGYGQWSACDYGNSTCATTGTRSRAMTTYTCNASGGCVSQTTTQSDAQACTRVTEGINCSTAPNDPCFDCGCSPTSCGLSTRTCTGKQCVSGACVSFTYDEPCPPCPGCQQQ